MTIEEDIFKKTKIDFTKLKAYGFQKDKSLYKYSQNIMNNNFRVDIEINNAGIVKGKIFDLTVNDEYTNFRMENNLGSFGKKVRDEFKYLLEDLKNNCFIKEYFLGKQTNRIVKNIQELYGNKPEFPWEKYPGYATFKNKESKKWYAIIMNINQEKLDKTTLKEVEIINLKLEPTEIEELLKENSFYPAYHMNKKNWITIILDNTVSDEKIMNLIKRSYSFTIPNKKIQ